MGYDYTVQGWFRSDSPLDLNGAVPANDHYDWTNDHPSRYVRVTGRDRNFAVFATQAKHRANYYVEVLEELIAHAPGDCYGLVAITGEIIYDGKDRLLLASEGKLRTLSTTRLYDPLSPWNAIYRWSHYMGRSVEDLVAPGAAELGRVLSGLTSLKGWLYLHDHHTSDADAERIMAGVTDREPSLLGGLEFLKQLSEPYLLVGQDEVEAASAVIALAELTARRERAYGMLYCSAPDQQRQVPVAFEQGRIIVLPEISLAAGTDEDLLPASYKAYEGLQEGSEVIRLRSTLDLPEFGRKLAQDLNGTPVDPHRGLREQTKDNEATFLFEAHGLICFLTEDRRESPAGWPYWLMVYLRGPADPDLLKARMAELVELLRSRRFEFRQGILAP